MCVCDRDGFVESSGRCWCVFDGEKVGLLCVCVCVCARKWVCICWGGGGVLLAHRLGGGGLTEYCQIEVLVVVSPFISILKPTYPL